MMKNDDGWLGVIGMMVVDVELWLMMNDGDW